VTFIRRKLGLRGFITAVLLAQLLGAFGVHFRPPKKNIVLKIVLHRFEKLFFRNLRFETPNLKIVLQNCFAKLF